MALQILVTTEQPSRYGSKMDAKNRTETKNQAKVQNTKTENQNPKNKVIALWFQEGRGHPSFEDNER